MVIKSSLNFNYIVLIKYSDLESPSLFLTSLKNLKINDLVFFYKNKERKVAIVVSSPIKSNSENVKKIPYILGYANKVDVSNYKKELFKNNLIIKTGNREAKKKKLRIKILFCQYNQKKNNCLLFFVSDCKKNIESFFKHLSNLLKLKVNYHLISHQERTKIIGGIGPCGRKLCCNIFSKEICKKISSQKKREASAEKTFGICNCLKCCLFFDDNFDDNVTNAKIIKKNR